MEESECRRLYRSMLELLDLRDDTGYVRTLLGITRQCDHHHDLTQLRDYTRDRISDPDTRDKIIDYVPIYGHDETLFNVMPRDVHRVALIAGLSWPVYLNYSLLSCRIPKRDPSKKHFPN